MRHIAAPLFAVLSSAIVFAQVKPPTDPALLVRASLTAQGGEAALRAIHAVRVEVAGHANALEQSERPEGPFIVNYEQATETRDFDGQRWRREAQQRSAQGPSWSPAVAVVVNGDTPAMSRAGRSVPGRASDVRAGQRSLELGPERVLLTALSATDLRTEPDIALQGMKQQAVSFAWRGGRVRLLLNPHNHLLTAVDVIGPDDLFTMWGDTVLRTYYSYWNIERGGARYPYQADAEWNGTAKGSSTVMKLELNPELADAMFDVPEDVRKAFASAKPTGFSTATLQPAQSATLAPGVTQVPGSWNVAYVEQPDGLVIIEAPIGSAYSVQVLEEAARRFPTLRVKAVVTTSDAWPHLGGVREYAARGIPIYALDLNRPILERLLAAPYRTDPDTLARKPAAAKFTWVSAKTVIGSGDTRVELYPFRGENGERMMMAYFPAHRLLYSSDEIIRQRNGTFFMPEYLLEVREAIAREKLDVTRVFGMHLPETPWNDVETALQTATGVKP